MMRQQHSFQNQNDVYQGKRKLGRSTKSQVQKDMRFGNQTDWNIDAWNILGF